MSNTYSPRRILVVLAALALPAATCGVAPAVRDLMLRTQRLERFVENAQLPPVLVDDRGTVIGRVLEYNDVMLYTSVALEQPLHQGKTTPWDHKQRHAMATVLFEVPGQRPVALEAWTMHFFAPVRGVSEEYFFETLDCTGTAWIETGTTLSAFGHARIAPPGHTLYTADLDAPTRVTIRAKLVEFNGPRSCTPLDGGFNAPMVPMNPVYDLDAFTPPFEIADQRDLWLQ